MKIRTDYVSNSSSSSFVVYGTKIVAPEKDMTTMDHMAGNSYLTDVIGGLAEDEALYLVLRNAGSEGDYIIKLSAEFIMDCDMHQIDLLNDAGFVVIRGKYVMSEGGYMYKASSYTTEDNEYYDEDAYELLQRTASSDGIVLDGMRMFKYYQDYGHPKTSHEALEEVTYYAKRKHS